MPFINVKISENLSDTQVDNIKSRLGEAISLIPGKSEAWLMVNIQDNCKLYFKGQTTNRLHLPTSVFSVLPQSPIVKILRRLFATF